LSSLLGDKEVSMLHNPQNILAEKGMPAPDATSASISREQLQEHWLRLRIKRSTLLYLQQVLDQQDTSIHAHIDPGVAMALIATRALATEKRGKSVLKEGEEFLADELRQTFIEGLGQHCVETVRILLGTLAALQLHLFRPPLFWPGAAALSTSIALSLVVLLVYAGCIIAHSKWKTQRGSAHIDAETPSQATTTARSASFV
jgi:hypothetical protein